MPTPYELVITEYFSAIREKNLERLIRTFASGAELYDPVGTPVKKGTKEIRAFFSQTFAAFQMVKLTEEHIYACGTALAVKWVGAAAVHGGDSCEFEGIDSFECTDDGQIRIVRAYWNNQPVMDLLQP